MPETIYDSKFCQLWENTKNLAQERGLTIAPECPVASFCKVGCLMMKLTDQDKLAQLRKELKEIERR